MHTRHLSHADSLTESPPAPACFNRMQIKAWKAGHKRECAAKGAAEVTDSSTSAVQQAAHPASMLTADHCRLLTTLQELHKEENWQGVVSLEGEALELATTVGGMHPAVAVTMHRALGDAFQGLVQHARSRGMQEQHKAMLEQHKTISEELEDRAQVAAACGQLGICFFHTGHCVRSRVMHADWYRVRFPVSVHASCRGRVSACREYMCGRASIGT